MKICKVTGCTSIHCGLEFCNKHYLRFKKHGDSSITKYQEFCNQKGCNNKHSHWGLCSTHAARVRHTGVTDLLPPSNICNESDCSEDVFRNKKCTSHWNERFSSFSKCDYCLKTFVRLKCRENERKKIGSGRSFCSIPCRQNFTAEFGFKPKQNLEWCDWCERPYSKPRSLGIRTKLTFCTLKCVRIYQSHNGWYEAHNKGDSLSPEQRQRQNENLEKWRKEHEPCRSESVQECLMGSNSKKCFKGRKLTEKEKIPLRKGQRKRKYTSDAYAMTKPERKLMSMLSVNGISFQGGIKQIWDQEKQKWRNLIQQKYFPLKASSYHKADVFIEPNIVLEADGWHHKYHHDRDCKINEELIEQNQKIFRFSEELIHKNPQQVFHKILIVIKEHAPKLFEQKNLSDALTFNFKKYGYPV